MPAGRGEGSPRNCMVAYNCGENKAILISECCLIENTEQRFVLTLSRPTPPAPGAAAVFDSTSETFEKNAIPPVIHIPLARPPHLPQSPSYLYLQKVISMAQQLKSISWWHEQLVDWMLLNPDKPFKDAAKVFNVSINYLYMLKNSDSFQAYWNYRRSQRERSLDEKMPELFGSLQTKLASVADMSLDQILQQLERNEKLAEVDAPSLSTEELRTVADTALRRLGYGIVPSNNSSSTPGAPNINVQVNVDAAALAAAREKMQLLHGVAPAAPALVELKTEEKDVLS